MGRWADGAGLHSKNACFSEGMSRSMKRTFDFVNIAGNAFNTITDDLIDREYEVNVSTATVA